MQLQCGRTEGFRPRKSRVGSVGGARPRATPQGGLPHPLQPMSASGRPIASTAPTEPRQCGNAE